MKYGKNRWIWNRKNITHQTLLFDVGETFHILQVQVVATVVLEEKIGAQERNR